MSVILSAVEECILRGGNSGLENSLEILEYHKPLLGKPKTVEDEKAITSFLQTLAESTKDRTSEKCWKAVNVFATIIPDSCHHVLTNHAPLVWDALSKLLHKKENLRTRIVALNCLRSLVLREHDLQLTNALSKSASSSSGGQSLPNKLMSLAVDCVTVASSDDSSESNSTISACLEYIYQIVSTSSSMGRVGVQRFMELGNSLIHHHSEQVRLSAAKCVAILPTCVGGGVEENWKTLIATVLTGAARMLAICTKGAKRNSHKMNNSKVGNASAGTGNNKNIEAFYAPLLDWVTSQTGTASISVCAHRFQGLCAVLELCLTQGTTDATCVQVPVQQLLQLAQNALPRDAVVAASQSNTFRDFDSPARFAVIPQLVVATLSVLNAFLLAAGPASLRNYGSLAKYLTRLVQMVNSGDDKALKNSVSPFTGPKVKEATYKFARTFVQVAGPTAQSLASEALIPMAISDLVKLLPDQPGLLGSDKDAENAAVGVSQVGKVQNNTRGGTSARSTRRRKGVHRTVVSDYKQTAATKFVQVAVLACELLGTILLSFGSLLKAEEREGIDWITLTLLSAGPNSEVKVDQTLIMRNPLLHERLTRCLAHSIATPVCGTYQSHSFTNGAYVFNHKHLGMVSNSMFDLCRLGVKICENQLHPKGSPAEFMPPSGASHPLKITQNMEKIRHAESIAAQGIESGSEEEEGASTVQTKTASKKRSAEPGSDEALDRPRSKRMAADEVVNSGTEKDVHVERASKNTNSSTGIVNRALDSQEPSVEHPQASEEGTSSQQTGADGNVKQTVESSATVVQVVSSKSNVVQSIETKSEVVKTAPQEPVSKVAESDDSDSDLPSIVDSEDES